MIMVIMVLLAIGSSSSGVQCREVVSKKVRKNGWKACLRCRVSHLRLLLMRW